MKKKYIFLISCMAFTNLTAKANNEVTPIPQTIPQTQYDSIGSVTGIMNRIPRSFDTQTLINSGPGLLQETFFLFKKLGSNHPQQTENQNLPTVKEPEVPSTPVNKEVVYQETQTIIKSSNQQTNNQSSPNTVFTNSSSNEINKIEPIKPIPDETPFIGNDPPPILMLPAPRPGYIIRYNEQLKVYEEVREIKTQNIQPVKPE